MIALPILCALPMLPQIPLAAVQEIPGTPLPVTWFLIMSLFLFTVGVLTVITRRNTVYILMGVEFMLNAASLNFVAFGKLRGQAALLDGTVISVFIIVLAAAEAAVGLAIILNIFGLFGSVRPEDPNLMRE